MLGRTLARAGCGLALALVASTASGQSAGNVLVVINSASEASAEVGAHYVEVRGVPEANVVRLEMPLSETVSRDDYERRIEAPLAGWLRRHALQDRILYIVLTKGVPIRIKGTGGSSGTVASVDSELTLLYRRMLGDRVSPVGPVENPYFAGSGLLAEFRPFARTDHDIYLVTRLDGFTVADVLALIDRGLLAAREGTIVLDQRASPAGTLPDRWLRQAADRLRDRGDGERVVLEDTTAAAAPTGPVLGYYSWGANDPANRRRSTGLTFAPGALAAIISGGDGRTFEEPPGEWVPGRVLGANALFAGSGQPLAGDFIREGITGMAASVADPLLDGSVRPDVLFPAYLAGLNLAEAFYAALPNLSWETLVIGDPLVAPFSEAAPDPAPGDRGLDPVSEMPAIFTERRLERLKEASSNVQALKYFLRGQLRFELDDEAGGEEALIEATALEPMFAAANLRLGDLYNGRHDVDNAIDRYRRVVEAEPRNVIALNNLAYLLAVEKAQLDEALELARRATRVASIPEVSDTFGWIHHLMGDHTTAAFWIDRAVAAAPGNAEVRYHSAAVQADLGNLDRARRDLAAALAADPSLAERPEVVALQARIGK